MKKICKTILAGAVMLAGTTLGGGTAFADVASCAPSETDGTTTVTCTIEAIVNEDVKSRTVVVSLLGQEVTRVTTPPVNTPDTTTQTIAVAVTQVGSLVGHTTSDCSADVSVSGGTAQVSVVVNGTTLATASVAVPNAGEVFAISAC